MSLHSTFSCITRKILFKYYQSPLFHPSTPFYCQVQTNSCNILHPWHESWKMTFCIRLNLNWPDLTLLIPTIMTQLSLWDKNELSNHKVSLRKKTIYSQLLPHTLFSQWVYWTFAQTVTGFSYRTGNLLLLGHCFYRTFADLAKLYFIKGLVAVVSLHTSLWGSEQHGLSSTA